MNTEGNAAADEYHNTAFVWATGRGDKKSNLVQTAVASRSISGLVWYDANLNGIRDEGENTVKEVECTLFKKKDGKTYSKYTMDITYGEVGSLSANGTVASPGTYTTSEDGKYNFEKLEAGDYVVAFKGEGLAPYSGSTFYQVNGSNDAVTNDGMGATGNAKAILDKINDKEGNDE